MQIRSIPGPVLGAFRRGGVIPAQPLALNARRKLSERHQRALTRYYIAAGASGLAVGVHGTQFEIRDPAVALFEPVLTLASETIDQACATRGHGILKIAGVCGKTPQATREASFAEATGYHACLLSLAALKDAPLPAVCDAGREQELTLYTGNDDNLVVDLLTEYRIQTAKGTRAVRIAGTSGRNRPGLCGLPASQR